MSAAQWSLERRSDGLWICHSSGALACCLDLADIERRARQGKRLALARACRAGKGLLILDPMAGWGTDGLVLARLGCHVHMVERHPLVFEMLRDRVARFDATHPGIATCQHGDVTFSATEAGAEPYAVYLDPMFGAHPKTALPDKDMQILEALVGSADDGAVGDADLVRLIAWARDIATDRVVVKRRASVRPAVPPDWQIVTKSIRFDVYRASRFTGAGGEPPVETRR